MSDNGNIHKALAAIVTLTEASRAAWVVGGSAGLMLRGLKLTADPRDLDLYCDEADVSAIYQSLRSFATDEPVLSTTSMYRSTLCHFSIQGVQVELVGGFRVSSPSGSYETNVRGQLLPYSEVIRLDGSVHSVHVVPLAHELWFNRLRGREDRVALIAESMASSMRNHDRALQAIEDTNTFHPEAKDGLHALLRIQEAGGLK